MPDNRSVRTLLLETENRKSLCCVIQAYTKIAIRSKKSTKQQHFSILSIGCSSFQLLCCSGKDRQYKKKSPCFQRLLGSIWIPEKIQTSTEDDGPDLDCSSHQSVKDWPRRQWKILSLDIITASDSDIG